MYVKMIDETLNVANMPDEEAIQKDYKKAIFSDKPIAENGHHAESKWVETEDSYVQTWSIVEDTDESEEADPEEIINILTGEEEA